MTYDGMDRNSEYIDTSEVTDDRDAADYDLDNHEDFVAVILAALGR